MEKSKINWIEVTPQIIEELKKMDCVVIMALEDYSDESFDPFFEYQIEHTSFFKNGYFDQMDSIDRDRFKLFAIISEPYDN